MLTTKYQKLEETLDLWFKEARATDINISGPIICNKAETLAKLMRHPEFQCSSGWLDRFKTRHSYTLHKDQYINSLRMTAFHHIKRTAVVITMCQATMTHQYRNQ